MFSPPMHGYAYILFRTPLISFYMAGKFTRQGSLAMRVLITLGALLSLCLSDTVGPRLLPLPAADEYAATARHVFGDAGVSPVHPRGEPETVRVAMAQPARRQAGAEQSHLHVTAHAAAGLIKLPVAAPTSFQTACPLVAATSAATTRPPGRAPPPSV